MKKLLLSFVVAILVNSAFGQHDLGLKLNGGTSLVNTNLTSSLDNQKVRFQFSGQGGVYYNYGLPKHFMVGAELLWVQIEGKSITTSVMTDDLGRTTGYLIEKVWHNHSYLGLPVYFGYRIKNFSINLGFQINYMLTGSSIDKVEVPGNGTTQTYETIHKKLSFDNFDYGPRIGVTYGISKRFSVEANYYYGLNNLFPNNNPHYKCNIQQLTAGLRFKLFKITE